MLSKTLLWIILAASVAIAFALFQYGTGKKKPLQKALVYGVLRFLSVFGLLLLLVNPKWTQVNYYNEKPSLAIAVDNSLSINHLGYDSLVKEAVLRFRESKLLKEKFDIQYYKFGSNLTVLDSLDFSQKQTNISKVFSSLSSLYKRTTAPTILVTDGNQTFGRSYQYTLDSYDQEVYPLIAADTIQYEDIKVERINVNRYAYVKNKFPVEIFLKYTGDASLKESLLEIKSGNRILHKEILQFARSNSSVITNVLLPADRVGVCTYTAVVSPLETEKNKVNNTRNFAVEVIDQKTNVLVVSNLVHPDIGVLKKSIESNNLRTVTIASTAESAGKINEYQLIILYQPNEQFINVYKEIADLNKNHIVITGAKSDWNVINKSQNNVRREFTGQMEEVQAVVNPNFSSFTIPDIGFSEFPPLLGSFGDIEFTSEVDIAFFQKIGTVNTSQPLIAATDLNGQRVVHIFGEGIWKWRSQSYREQSSFKEFDNFMDKLVQYTASNKRKNRLDISYDSFYYGTSDIKVSAQYFDKNYVFDRKATLEAVVINKESKERVRIPFLLKGNYFEVDLSTMSPGDYTFTVTAKDQNLSRSGSFKIIPFETEQQFLNADMEGLNQLATKTEGAIYSMDKVNNLINALITDNRYRAIQKSNEKVVPLIDRKWLLGLVILFLAMEWFIRKYHGLT